MIQETIKPQELRIDNWIVDDFGRYGKVTVIRERSLRYKCANADHDFAANYLNVLGIPLSSDILQKAGFEPNKKTDNRFNYWYNSELDYYLEYDWILRDGYSLLTEYEQGRLEPIGERSKHVHTLQNLVFALTQKELKIDL